jgi:hypothetical protein
MKKGSINMTYGTEPKFKHNRFGKNYFSIDFFINEGLNENMYEKEGKKRIYQPIGEFQIGDNTIPLTYKEIQRIYETMQDTLITCQRKYSFGF